MDEVGSPVRAALAARPAQRRIGEGLWRAPLRQVGPDGAFFPRTGYAALPLNSGKDVYLLGGQQGGRMQNDAWLLRLRPAGASWMLVSPHKEPRRLEEGAGTVVSGKWSGRERFGHALATVRKGCMALYVCGGRNAQSVLEDVWASEDNGSSWYCMAQHPPFGVRCEPGLAAVPGHYEQLVLCGGWANAGTCLQPSGDVWVSTDAGTTWQEVTGLPTWPPRCVPVMAFLPGTTESGSRRLLVFGGACLSTFQRVNITPGMLADAWELELDIQTRACSGRRLGETGVEGNSGRAGFNGRTAAFDYTASPGWASGEGAAFWDGPGALVAGLNGRLCLSPLSEPQAWAPARFGPPEADEPLQQEDARGSLPHLALACGPRSSCPRLFLFCQHGVYASSDAELRWQHRLLRRLGERLDAAGGLPFELWLARVVPAILPEAPPQPPQATPALRGRPEPALQPPPRSTGSKAAPTPVPSPALSLAPGARPPAQAKWPAR